MASSDAGKPSEAKVPDTAAFMHHRAAVGGNDDGADETEEAG